MAAFQKLVYDNAYDVIGVTETWLTDYITDSEILDTGYMIFRCDRIEQMGGGVLIAVKNDLNCCRRSDLETDLEMVCIELNLLGSSKILLSTVYRPPDTTPSNNHTAANQLNMHMRNSATRLLKSNSIIVGDFKYPNIQWTEGCSFSGSTSSADAAFCEVLQDHALFQLNTYPTRNNNILDLIITNATDRIVNIEPMTPAQAGLSTDHDLLEYEIIARPQRIKNLLVQHIISNLLILM